MSGISKPLPLRKDIAFSFGLTKILRNVKKKKKIFNFQFSKRKLKNVIFYSTLLIFFTTTKPIRKPSG